jgi:hypothetical protein
VKRLATVLCLLPFAAQADPLVRAETNAIAICVSQDGDHAARVAALRDTGWFVLVPGSRAEAVAALASGHAAALILSDPKLSLADAHAQRFNALDALSTAPDSALGQASWFEGGSVTGRSFLLLETLPTEVTCALALGRPTGFDDLTRAVGGNVTSRAITGATLGQVTDAAGATLLFAFLPDPDAYAIAGITQMPTLVIPRSVTRE